MKIFCNYFCLTSCIILLSLLNDEIYTILVYSIYMYYLTDLYNFLWNSIFQIQFYDWWYSWPKFDICLDMYSRQRSLQHRIYGCFWALHEQNLREVRSYLGCILFVPILPRQVHLRCYWMCTWWNASDDQKRWNQESRKFVFL